MTVQPSAQIEFCRMTRKAIEDFLTGYLTHEIRCRMDGGEYMENTEVTNQRLRETAHNAFVELAGRHPQTPWLGIKIKAIGGVHIDFEYDWTPTREMDVHALLSSVWAKELERNAS